MLHMGGGTINLIWECVCVCRYVGVSTIFVVLWYYMKKMARGIKKMHDGLWWLGVEMRVQGGAQMARMMVVMPAHFLLVDPVSIYLCVWLVVRRGLYEHSFVSESATRKSHHSHLGLSHPAHPKILRGATCKSKA